MRRAGAILMLLCSAFGADGVRAADYSAPALKSEVYQPPSWAPTFGIVGTVAPSWTNNAFFSRDNRQDDWYLNTDVSFRMDGRFTSDLTYRLYVRSEADIFAREKDVNAALALWGARLARNVGNWQAIVTYENRYQFDGFYRDRAFTAHDVKGALASDFMIGNVIFLPFIQGRYRFSDLEEAEYWRLDLAMGIEAPLNERWSIVSSPFFEAYWFTGGLNSGRADQIYSVSLGLKYNIASNISLTTSIAYEERKSNVDLRKYQDIEIGPRLSFAS
jgi:hypothetical protein